MGSPIVRVSDVGLSYRRRKSFFRHEYYQAIKSVTFDLYRGETLGILGRNGSGKSTLLKLIAGVFSPDRGLIQRNCGHISMLSLGVGFDGELSGRDNIILSAMLLGASRKRAYDNVPAIIEFSELEGFIDKPIKTYSSGMRMRLGFSVAIMIRPDVLLIDEVLGTGDARFRKKAEAAISDRILSDQTVVLVTHNGSQMKALCHRVLWLEGGVIRMEGKPDQVVAHYEEFIKGSSEGIDGRQISVAV